MFRYLLLGFLFLASPAMAQEDLKQEIGKLVITYQDHVSKKDAAGIAALYAKDGVMVNAAGVQSDIAKYYETAFKNGLERLDGKVDHIWPMADGSALVQGETRITGKNDKSEPIDTTVIWTAVDVKESGQWKIKMLTVIPKAPPK